MKVTQWVTVETEVDVHIGVDDIAAAITDDADSFHGVLRAFNNIIMFGKALPDEMLVKLTDKQRELIVEHLDAFTARIRG